MYFLINLPPLETAGYGNSLSVVHFGRGDPMVVEALWSWWSLWSFLFRQPYSPVVDPVVAVFGVVECTVAVVLEIAILVQALSAGQRLPEESWGRPN